MTDIHSERLTKQNVHQNLSQTSNFSTRISVLLSRLYVHWGHFGLEDSTLIVVALVLPSSPSLSLASQTLSGVWLARLGPFHEAAAHAQNLVLRVQLSRDQHMVFRHLSYAYTESVSPPTLRNANVTRRDQSVTSGGAKHRPIQ